MERRNQRKQNPFKRFWSKFKLKEIITWLSSNNIKAFKSKGLIKKILAICSVMIILGLLILNILIWKSDVSKLEDPAPQPTIIYDQNGAVASKISVSNIEGVSIKQIPEEVIEAVIVTEDQRFYKHGGINYFGIMRAFTTNLINGEIVAGGSTITQQLAKNIFLTHERTYTRKIKELILTKKIERTYSKDEIIERYLNQIYFGEGAWGIQRAAQTYFGKDASELTLSESAMLAGLIKAPSVLSPFKNMEKSVERRDLVLTLMEKEGYISQKEMEEAKGHLIVLEGKKIDDYKGKYPYYVDHIIAEAIKKYDLTENEVLSGGLHIYTELNQVIQKAIEQVYSDESIFPKSQPDQLIQSGAVFINPESGGIQALVGGRGEHVFRGFNRATQLKRQPGSTMKPLAVYTPALEQGYEVFDQLQDSPIDIDGYKPLNYDKQFRGEVSMYEALVQSYNVPPVWLVDRMGLQYSTNSVERFGIPLTEEDYSPALALGGMSEGVSPLLMAQAFSAFPNEGVRMEAHSIQKIENSDGETVGRWSSNAVKVTTPSVAQKITFMLKGVVEEGTGKQAKVSGWEIAGKTGTTELPFDISNGAKDHWFVGYTPEIVGAVWIGYDHTDETHYLPASSGSTVTKIFKGIFTESMTEFSQRQFDLPEKLEKQLNNQLKEEEKQKEEAAERLEEEKREAEKGKWWGLFKQKDKEDKEEEKDRKKKEKEDKKKEKEDKE